MKDYKIFLQAYDKLVENQEAEFELVDAATLEVLRVKAVVARSFAALPDPDRVWLCSRGASHLLEEQPWAIKVIEIIEEEPEDVTIQRQRISLGRRKGSILETLIRERQEGATKDRDSGR